MKQKIYNNIVDALNKAGICFSGERFIYLKNPVEIDKFLLNFAGLGYKLGFDLFDGVCSGLSTILVEENNLLSLIATDCGTDRFTFAVNSVFVILGDKDDNSCPTIVFESKDLNANMFTSFENVRKSEGIDKFDYIKVAKPKDGVMFNPIFNIDEVDELLYKRHCADEDVPPFYSEIIYLNKKIVCCLNVQTNRELIHPFSFRQFLLRFKDSSSETVNEFFKQYFR